MPPQRDPIRVWLIDDNELFRIVIREFLKSHPRIILQCFASCEAAFESLKDRQLAPDVVLLDIELDGMSGLDAIPQFGLLAPETSIVILTSFPSDGNIEKAISLGASGFLEKSPTTLNKIVPCIENALEGIMVLDRRASQKVQEVYELKSVSQADYDLTDRETEALRHFAQGLTTEEVAQRMYLSASTVLTYEDSLHKKLGTKNRAKMVAKAIREGLV